jgi:hypothetical protein
MRSDHDIRVRRLHKHFLTRFLGRDKQQTSYDHELRYDFTSYRSCLGETRDDSPKRNTDFVVQCCLVSLGGEFGLGAVVGLGTICLVSLDDWHDEGLVPKALNGGNRVWPHFLAMSSKTMSTVFWHSFGQAKHIPVL